MWTLTSFLLSLRLQTGMPRLGKTTYSPTLLCLQTFLRDFPDQSLCCDWTSPYVLTVIARHTSTTLIREFYQNQVYFSQVLQGTGDAQRPFLVVSEEKRSIVMEGKRLLLKDLYLSRSMARMGGDCMIRIYRKILWVEFSKGKQSHSCVSMEVTQGFLKRHFMVGAA